MPPVSLAESQEEEDAHSKLTTVLDRLEQAHRQENETLIEANQEFKNPGLTKVSKMLDKIRKVKEALGTYEEKEKNLLDQPNSDGNTLMHITTNLDDDEATEMLLDHGANSNVQDAEGNSPLHTICSQRDIQTATSILKSNGNLLSNKKMKTPALAELFFDQDEEEVKKMMLAVDQSNHRTEILNEILRKEHLLFRLIEEDKSEVLSIVLRTLTEAERETYVNLV